MKIRDAIKLALDFYKLPLLDSELILSFALNKSREWLVTHIDFVLNSHEKNLYIELIKKRKEGEPLSYITGNKEFWGLNFIVDKNVLVPRPETEMIVEEVVKTIKEGDIKQPLILDLGTGSGIIPISISKEIPDAKIIATDISQKALEVALFNAKIHNVHENIFFINCNWFSCLNHDIKFHFVVSNPPYIDESLRGKLGRELDFEPDTSLYAGKNGLEYIYKILENSWKYLRDNGVLLIEIGWDQGKKASDFAEKIKKFRNIEILKDINGLDRLIKCLN